MALRIRNFLAPLLLSCLSAGCMSGPHSSPGAPPATVLADKRVVLDSIVVQTDDGHGALEISGAVHRRPGVAGSLSGRVDIEYINVDGELLDEWPVRLDPTDLSTNKPSTFHTPYYIPPKGSRIRIHFVDAQTEIAEDFEGFVEIGDEGTGATSKVPQLARAKQGSNAGKRPPVSHYSNGHQMGFGSNFGVPNFGPR